MDGGSGVRAAMVPHQTQIAFIGPRTGLPRQPMRGAAQSTEMHGQQAVWNDCFGKDTVKCVRASGIRSSLKTKNEPNTLTTPNSSVLELRTRLGKGLQDHSRGALLVIFAAFMFACMGASVKTITARLPNEMAVFFRNVRTHRIAPLAAHSGTAALATRRLKHHMLRSLAGLSAMYCFFYAITHMQLAEAVLLNYTAPLFIPFVAFILLREPITRGTLWAGVIGFFGIALILRPGTGLFTLTALVGLASGALAALAVVTVRGMSDTEPAPRIVFYFSTLSTAVSAVPLLWSWQTPEPALWGLFAVAGIFATAGQLFLTRGYALGLASQIGPFTYSAVPFATALGWLLWSERPDALAVGGAFLICLAGMLALRSRHPPEPQNVENL